MKRFGKPPFICLITDGTTRIENFDSRRGEITRTIRDAVSDGINIVQIRERELPARHLFDLTREIVECIRESDAVVLVNDRADVAVAAGADGVHLRESSLPSEVIRRNFSRDLVIGVSTHSVEAARSAAAGGADFAFFGPVFESPGKGNPVGAVELGKVCRAVGRFPVIALGGISSENVSRVTDAGAVGVAGIRFMYDAEERRRIVRGIRARIL